MLTPDQAAERLAQFTVSQWVARSASAIRGLPQRVAEAARPILVPERTEDWSYERQQAQDTEFVRRFEALSAQQRLDFFTGLFPRLAAELERAWTDLGKGTFSSGVTSVPFRAPNRPDLISDKRGFWLVQTLSTLSEFDPDAEWLATWAPHISHGGASVVIGPILAAAIDLGGPRAERVLDVLRQSASGTHEIGAMGRHVTLALLGCSRPDAWEFMERVLLSAQREEGLRQSILEAVDEAHPLAFRRFLRLILDHNLIRFSSTVRAVDVWFRFLFDALSAKQAGAAIRRTLEFLEDRRARLAAMVDGEGEGAYLALWAEAFEDADSALRLAEEVSKGPSEERRFAAATLLGHLEMFDAVAPLTTLLDDPDIRVAARAMDSLWKLTDLSATATQGSRSPRTFDGLLRLLHRVQGKGVMMKPLVFPWERTLLRASDIGALLVRWVPDGQAPRLLPVLDRFSADSRADLACLLAGEVRVYHNVSRGATPKDVEGGVRAALIQLLGDPSSTVRTVVGEILGRFPLRADEAVKHEQLLERSASDIRSRALERLASLGDAPLLAASERLLSGGEPARSAALELLIAMTKAERSLPGVRLVAETFRKADKKLTLSEKRQLGLILDSEADSPQRGWTLANGLGLLDESKRGRLTPPRSLPGFEFDSTAAKVLLDLDAIVKANATRELGARFDTESDPALLGGNRFWGVRTPSPSDSLADRVANCPVRDLLDAWLLAQPGPRELTQQTILRAYVAWNVPGTLYKTVESKQVKLAHGLGTIRFQYGTDYLLEWLMSLHGPADAANTTLNWTESVVARECPESTAASKSRWAASGVMSSVKNALKGVMGSLKSAPDDDEDLLKCPSTGWLAVASRVLHVSGDRSGGPDRGRMWNLERWVESHSEIVRAATARYAELQSEGAASWELQQRLREVRSLRPNLASTLAAWAAGVATEHDFYAVALHCDDPGAWDSFHEFKRLCRPSTRKDFRWPDGADAAFDAIRKRVLEIEFARGDAPTPASRVALALAPSGGMDVVIRVLARIGRDRLLRGYMGGQTSRSAVYSSLLRSAVPGPGDTPERFAASAKAESLLEERLIDLAVYAPQWADHVEQALGWPGLAEGVWWIHAHTKDHRWSIDHEILAGWDARIAERTAVPKEDLADGAVDPEWFARVFQTLGQQRWEVLYDAAKYASGAGGHKRAQLYADAMLSKTSEQELRDRIDAKRHQDAIRALGLCPVASGKAGTDQVLVRYKVMQEYRRSSSRHGGSMLQASEKRAVEIGMENLARTAGYADPVRLQWAMETEAIADLAKGPVTVTVGETAVSLAIEPDGTPSLSAVKNGKLLKAVPASAKSKAEVKSLATRLTDLRRQVSRMRLSLEQAMCRGDEFSGEEMASLWRHPVLRPMLSALVVTSSSGLGYLSDEARALRDESGRVFGIARDARLRIAHPHDLLVSGRWHDWQSECMTARRVQPFKQVFRELYVPTPVEKRGALQTTRYAGHQVQPRKAMALFGSRGWVARPEEGVHRTFHHERITAFVSFQEAFFTPAEVECLTLSGLAFLPVGKHTPIALEQLPPRLFSEVLRDMDLVVSVAHAGGVDPEASQSSIQMRADLLRETARVLALDNVTVEATRAMIKGRLAHYALHLGSGSVQMLPGGSVFIVAVQSQHRGRVFLPFADDDPRTAEVLAKAILLARDHEIRDPVILEQIRR